MLIPIIRRPARAAVIAALALGTGLAACGGDDKPTPVAAAASGSALLAQIPTLGEGYPTQLARFVDSEAGKDHGLGDGEQGLVGVKESPSAPPESRSFIKEKRCSALNRQLNDNGDVLDAAGSAQEIKDAMTANNLIVAKAKALGCGFAQNLGFFVTT